MKKLVLAAAALATLSFSTSASALDTRFVREIRSVGLPVQPLLGFASFTALGVDAQHCMYLMEWHSPFNPNMVELCVLAERRTPVFPSCVGNALMDINSHISSGPGSQCHTWCSGFDNLGIRRRDVTILAGESPLSPTMEGVAIYPLANHLLLPIAIA